MKWCFQMILFVREENQLNNMKPNYFVYHFWQQQLSSGVYSNQWRNFDQSFFEVCKNFSEH